MISARLIHVWVAAMAATALMPSASVWAQEPAKPVYRCPGTPVLYTDALSAKEAVAKGCRTLEGNPITVIQGPGPRTKDVRVSPPSPPAASRPDTRIDPNEQKARDTDARRILEAELSKAEEQLAQMKRDYNNGQPERLGEERNFQKYMDRVDAMKAAIGRKEGDIAAIKREMGKLR